MIGDFSVVARDGAARLGRFVTAHGEIDTPAFMCVGTQGTVKGMTPDRLEQIGAQIILSNTYHLHLRPGDELIRDLGGLHKFMHWNRPILTDSGGFQVFSLAKLRKITDNGVTFQSHIDGARIEFTPAKVVKIQENLGVDIMMVLDECLEYPASRERVIESMERTYRWAGLSQEARSRKESLAFGIVQGGMYEDLRQKSAEQIVSCDFNGYAIGGLSVGESREMMLQMTQAAVAKLPDDKIHYLMGVGTPSDIVQAVACGIDLFDCVIPTRSARFGRLFTKDRFINIRNEKYRNDSKPVDESCDCYTCKNFSRAYLAHLLHSKEALFVELASTHNIRFYLKLMEEIRCAIKDGSFSEYASALLSDRTEQGTVS